MIKVKPGVVKMIPAENGPKFYIVRYIIIKDNNEAFFVIKKFRDVFYDEHFQAFEVTNEEARKWKCLTWGKVNQGIITHMRRTGNGLHYIAKKWP